MPIRAPGRCRPSPTRPSSGSRTTWTTATRCPGPGEHSLRDVVVEALRIAEDKGVEDLIAFATSAVREAKNGEQVLARIREQTGAQINVMTGHEEARLTFLAARRWFGWSSGRLLVIDIGGGSLEVASGIDEEPDAVVSLPLGAGRLTRDWITADPPPAHDVRRLRKHVRAQIASETGGMLRHGPPDHVVGTSKTFRQLARIAGAAPSGEGPYVKRVAQARRRRRAGRTAAQDVPGRAGQAARRLGQPGGPASRRAPSWPTPPWTCWASTSSSCAPGRCAKASSSGAWTCSPRALRMTPDLRCIALRRVSCRCRARGGRRRGARPSRRTPVRAGVRFSG